MKKFLCSIAFLGLIAVNTTAQNPADYAESEVSFETENLGSSNLLSGFLSYVIREHYSQTRQSGWLFGLYGQGGVIAGGIQNSQATMDNGISGQIGVGLRRQINATHSLTLSMAFSASTYVIVGGLYHGILGENSALVNYLLDNDYGLWADSFETLSRMNMELALGYRFNFGRNRRFGDIGSYFELGVFTQPFNGFGRYSSRVLGRISGDAGSYGGFAELGLSYSGMSISRPETGIQATLGWGSFAVYGRYRLTNPLSGVSSNPAVLPPVVFGVRIGF